MRARVGRLLRRWADRIDPANAPRKSGYSYTVERGSRTKNPNGIAVHIDGTGCPFYVMRADTHRAFSEAATDWRSPEQKLADMLEQFGRNVEDATRPAAEALANYWTDPRHKGSKPLSVEWKENP